MCNTMSTVLFESFSQTNKLKEWGVVYSLSIYLSIYLVGIHRVWKKCRYPESLLLERRQASGTISLWWFMSGRTGIVWLPFYCTELWCSHDWGHSPSYLERTRWSSKIHHSDRWIGVWRQLRTIICTTESAIFPESLFVGRLLEMWKPHS